MMLKGIDPLLSPDELHILAAMGHGDELHGNLFLSKGVVNPGE